MGEREKNKDFSAFFQDICCGVQFVSLKIRTRKSAIAAQEPTRDKLVELAYSEGFELKSCVCAV